MKRLTLMIAVLLVLAGCNRYDIDEILLQREEISLTMKGQEVLTYNPDTYQLGYNARKNEFRIFDDNMANWFSLTCESRPSTVGQELTADLKWTSANSTRTRNRLTFIVEKTDMEGHIWLWCESDAIGVIVKEL